MIEAAIRYAEALLAAAKLEKALETVTTEVRLLSCVFSFGAELLSAPVFPVKEQLRVIDFVLGNDFHPLTKRFFCLLASMHRLGDIEPIASSYDELVRKEMGQVDMQLTVYAEIPAEMEAELIEAAGKKGLFDWECRENINVHINFDKALMGGFVAECSGLSWDCSLRSRLNALVRR